jgi:hypothetical protein
MNRVFIVMLGVLFTTQIQAQLLNEIGVFVGGTNYSGDIGREYYVFPNKLGGSIIYKRNMNSRVSVRGAYSYLPIKADDQNSSNLIRQTRGPDGKGYRFNNTIHELSFGMEINFVDYDVLSRYEAATPYIFIEISGFKYNVAQDYLTTKYKISYAIPFGVGYKSKITDYLGYAVEIRGHYTFVDDLDYNDFNNSDLIKLRFGNPNTNDWYFFTGVSLTYSFGRPNCFVPRH